MKEKSSFLTHVLHQPPAAALPRLAVSFAFVAYYCIGRARLGINNKEFNLLGLSIALKSLDSTDLCRSYLVRMVVYEVRI